MADIILPFNGAVPQYESDPPGVTVKFDGDLPAYRITLPGDGVGGGGGADGGIRFPKYTLDYSTVIASTSTSGTYTISQDCYALFTYDMESLYDYSFMSISVTTPASPYPVTIHERGNNNVGHYEKQSTALFLFKKGTVIEYHSAYGELIQNMIVFEFPLDTGGP